MSVRSYIRRTALGECSHVTLEPFTPLPSPKRLAQVYFAVAAEAGLLNNDNLYAWADEIGVRVHKADGT